MESRKENKIFNQTLIRYDIDIIKKKYIHAGYPLSHISYEFKEIEPNKINLTYHIKPGPKMNLQIDQNPTKSITL